MALGLLMYKLSMNLMIILCLPECLSYIPMALSGLGFTSVRGFGSALNNQTMCFTRSDGVGEEYTECPNSSWDC